MFFHQLFLTEKLLTLKVNACYEAQIIADDITSDRVQPQNAFALTPYNNGIPLHKYLLVAAHFCRADGPNTAVLKSFLVNGYSPLELFSYGGDGNVCSINGEQITPSKLLARLSLDELKNCLRLVNTKEQISSEFVNALVEGYEKNVDSILYFIMSIFPTTNGKDKAFICECLPFIHELLNNGTPLAEIGNELFRKAEQVKQRSLSLASHLGDLVGQKLLAESSRPLLLTYDAETSALGELDGSRVYALNSIN